MEFELVNKVDGYFVDAGFEERSDAVWCLSDLEWPYGVGAYVEECDVRYKDGGIGRRWIVFVRDI